MLTMSTSAFEHLRKRTHDSGEASRARRGGPVILPSRLMSADATLAALLDQSLDCIKLISPSGLLEYMNRNGLCAMEIDDLASVAGRPWLDFWPDDAKAVVARALDDARGGAHARFDAFCPTAKGKGRWWDVSVSRVQDQAGNILGYLSVSRDVTEARTAREIAELAAAEMRHRLSNGYAMIGGLLSVLARGVPEREQFALEMRQRLSALGVAQTVFFGDQGAPVLARELLPTLLEAFSSPACTVVVGMIPGVEISQGQADALAIAFGELAVNSSKHGALSADGHVSVTAQMDGDTLELLWEERSSRAVSRHNRAEGQGLRLMQRVLSASEANIEIKWKEFGLDATIRLKIGR